MVAQEERNPLNFVCIVSTIQERNPLKMYINTKFWREKEEGELEAVWLQA